MKSFSRKAPSRASSRLRKSVRRQEFRRAMFESLEERRVMATTPIDLMSWTSNPHAPDQAIIRFNDGVSQAQAATLVQGQGGTIATYWPELNMASVHFYNTETPGAAFLRTQSLHYLPQVKYAEPNFIRTAQRTPNDPNFQPLKWDLNNTGQTVGTPDSDIDAPEAWDKFVGSPNEVIAVLDTGVDYAHPDLIDNMWINAAEIPDDGIDNDGNGYVDDLFGVDTVNNDSDPFDGQGHGTHVSGIAAARGDNGIGTVGVSWYSKIMAVKVLGDGGTGSTAAVIEGFRYVTLMKRLGVNVVVANASLGGGGFSQAEFDAIQAMNAQNVLLVAAAGNETTNNDSTPSYPASYILPGIISVAATGKRDELASFSNYGYQTVDLAAPGGNFVDSNGDLIFSTYPMGLDADNSGLIGYEFLQGTSMASPQVAGAAAVLAGYAAQNGFPLSVTDLKAIILNGVDKIPGLTGRVVTGGRLNLAKSMSLITLNEISGHVFRDSNGDGLKAPQEVGIAGFRAYVDINSNGVRDFNELSALTDANGNFTIKGRLGPATLTVRVEPQTGYSQTLPANNGGYSVTLVDKDQSVDGLLFGEKPIPGEISGYKFMDYNKNGIFDVGEPGIPNVVIYVDKDNNGRISMGEPAGVTDSNGFYRIIKLDPGTYNLREVHAPGFMQTYPDPNGPEGGARVGVVVQAGIVTNNQNFGNIAASDWGDLPDSYGTLGASNGPRHGILQGFQLGSRVDGESNGVPSATAQGDDSNAGTNDEDGVDFLNFTPGSTTAQVRVRVNSGSFAQGYLNGWIDWNNDGVFQGTEQVITSARLGTGTYLFSVPELPDSPPLQGYKARFRYGTESNLGPTGPSAAGEVEDYLTGLERLVPLAVDDVFTVGQNSTNNALHVLADNGFGADQKSKNGGPRIGDASIFVDATGLRGTVVYNDNGTPAVYSDDYFAYTPASGDIGVDTFKYKVQDDAGAFSDNYATVTINIKAIPRPVDDTFTLATATSTALNVLANDGQLSGINASQMKVIAVGPGTPSSQRPAGSLVPTSRLAINANGTIQYTPPSSSFVGTEFFTYTFAYDDDNNASTPNVGALTANVTVQVGAVGNTATASIELRPFKITYVSNPAGGQTIVETPFNPATDAYNVGDVIAIKAFTHDLRTPPPTYAGVESAFMDLGFDTNYVRLYKNSTEVDSTGNPLIPSNGVNFPNVAGAYTLYAPLASGLGPFTTETAGVLNEIGGFNSTGSGIGLANPLSPVFVAYFKAVAATPTGVTTNFIADPAEETPTRDVLVKVLDTAVSPEPQVTSLPDSAVFMRSITGIQIRSTAAGEGEFSNPFNTLDVNSDGVVSPVDVLMIINELNGKGSRHLSAQSIAQLGELLPAGYLDANVDAFLSPADALMVINYLNSVANSSQSAGEGEAGSAVSASSSVVVASSSVVPVASNSSSSSDNSTLTSLANLSTGSAASAIGNSSSSDSVSGLVNSNNSTSASFVEAFDSVLADSSWTQESSSKKSDSSSSDDVDSFFDELSL